MKKVIIILVCILAANALDAETSGTDEVDQAIIDNLATIENAYFKGLDSQERREAVELMEKTIEMIKSRLSGNHAGRKPRPLSDEAFAEILKSVSAEFADHNRTEKALDLTQDVRITCGQLKKLVALYSFDSRKVELIKAIFPRVMDPQNMVIVTPLITSGITRGELEEWLKDPQ
jgi:hypothetical protein